LTASYAALIMNFRERMIFYISIYVTMLRSSGQFMKAYEKFIIDMVQKKRSTDEGANQKCYIPLLNATTGL
jgi:hypothetical protein